MSIKVEIATINPTSRQALVQSFPCFSKLTNEQCHKLTQLMHEIKYTPGERVIHQDDIVDSVYFIVSGKAEVTLQTEFKKKIVSTPVAILGPNEGIGLNDTGFFSSTGKRTATVTAIADLLLLHLDLKDLHSFLQSNNLESGMYTAAEQMLRMRLIKQSLPFGKITHERLQWLCEKVEDIVILAGTVIFNQGDKGDRCYLIRSGKVEISAIEKDGSSHQLAILKPPTLFGEATLVTQQPRNATARALEDCQLLVLPHAYLTELWEKEHKIADMFMTLMVDRSRPLRNPKVTEHPRTAPDGQTIVILKNPETSSYFKLSQEGWFIWEQMNSKHTLLEITMSLANQYQIFSPNMVAALISKLAHAHFVQNVSTKEIVHAKETVLKKWLRRLRMILEFRLFFRRADYWLTKAYNNGVKLLFTRLGQLIFATLTISGFITFLYSESHIITLFRTLHDSWLLFIFMIPLTLLTVTLHELGHAFGTKAYGREVHSMGIGWQWTTPIAFADTTDMWLDTRWHRIAVNAAGLYTNLFVAGFCSLLILIIPVYYIQAFLWLFALTTYINGFAMLNPSQDLDGYFIMMDLFEKPYLRRDATVWLIKKLPASIKHPALFLKHGPEITYWITCILFLSLTVIITLFVQGFVLKMLGMTPPNIVSALILPLVAVIVASLTFIEDVKRHE